MPTTGAPIPPRKRILFYSHTRQTSGGERVLLTMLAVLDRTLYEPLAACPHTGPGNLEELLAAQEIEVLEAPTLQARFTSNPFELLGYLASTLRAILTFRATIRRAAPDLLHANSVRAGLVATLATLGTRTQILWHIHDDLPPHPLSTLIRRLAFHSKRTRLVAVSHHTARVFAARLPFGPRLQVLHNSVDTTRFPRKTNPLDPEATAIRAKINLTPTDFLAVAIGMINPRKGQLELVKTWDVVQRNLILHPAPRQAHLAIVGAPLFNDDHLYEQRVHALAATLSTENPVHFLGPRQDIPAILRAADLLVLNARTEPFGLVLLESISSGTPVLATDVGGIPEIIHDGTTGTLIPWANEHTYRGDEELGPALLAPIHNPIPALSMAERAHTETLPQFTLPVFRTNLQALYTSLTL